MASPPALTSSTRPSSRLKRPTSSRPTTKQVATVIRDMITRGAMAIGVSGAMGVALGIQNSARDSTISRAEPGGRRDLRASRRDPAHCGQSLLGHRPDSRALQPLAAAATRPSPRSRSRRSARAREMYDEDIAELPAARSERRSVAAARRAQSSPTATRARLPPAATARRWE